MTAIIQYNKWRILLFIGIILLAPHSPFAQTDLTNESDSTRYVNHQKESILDHLSESNMSKLELTTN